MLRAAAVAGMFYEGDQARLTHQIEQCFTNDLGPGRLPSSTEPTSGSILGLVCPHAGYVYSGPAAAGAYYELAEHELPDVAVLLGPNHYGLGAPVAVNLQPEWETPLGTVKTDAETARRILSFSDFAKADELAHRREHSIEVQLPFLQYIARAAGKTGGIAIVAVGLAHFDLHDAVTLASDLGRAIAKALEDRNAVVIASTDLTHYESKASANEKDAKVIERVLAMDPDGLLRVAYETPVSACGVIGTATMLHACKQMGASSARELVYYTSGDITGDTDQVVGYASMAIERA